MKKQYTIETILFLVLLFIIWQTMWYAKLSFWIVTILALIWIILMCINKISDTTKGTITTIIFIACFLVSSHFFGGLALIDEEWEKARDGGLLSTIFDKEGLYNERK